MSSFSVWIFASREALTGSCLVASPFDWLQTDRMSILNPRPRSCWEASKGSAILESVTIPTGLVFETIGGGCSTRCNKNLSVEKVQLACFIGHCGVVGLFGWRQVKLACVDRCSVVRRSAGRGISLYFECVDPKARTGELWGSELRRRCFDDRTD